MAQKKNAPARVKRSERKNIAVGAAHIKSTFNNTIISITDPQGNVISWKSAGTVGFISPLSRHFCSECNRLRVTADGKVRPCLFSDHELDVREALRNGDDEVVRAVLLEALGAKPDEHHDKVGTERNMSQIGG